MYEFQLPVAKDVSAFLSTATPGDSRLYSSPTGSGKTHMQVVNLQNHPELVQLVPSVEIAAGFLKKLGVPVTEKHSVLESHRIYTYQRMCNLLRDGKIDMPRYLQIDEAHHSASEREQLVWEYCNRVPRIGFTATPYRGTPRSTKEFLDQWGNHVVEILSIKQAVNMGVISMPKWITWPLIDDDSISIVNGEFVAKEVEKVVNDSLEQLVIQVGQLPKRPTMVALTTEKQCDDYVRLAHAHGYSATKVVNGTANRQQIFEDTLACKTILVQIRVVGEGVDLPLRRLIDAAPTMSPVLWQQRLGRITRPTDDTPEYYACCFNLCRHAYLWKGIMPPSAVRESQQAFNKPVSKRDILRGIGSLSGFGRFVPAPVPLSNGITASMYSLQSPDGLTNIAVLLHPLLDEPLYATRVNGATRGRWNRIAELPDVQGWVSTHNSPLTPRMEAYYSNMGEYCGLDTSVPVNARSFQAMPLLKDLGRGIVNKLLALGEDQ